MKLKSILCLSLSLLLTVPAFAEKRIYIVYGQDGVTELPHDQYHCYDYRRDWNKVDLWAMNMVGPGDVAEGGFWGGPWKCYWTNSPSTGPFGYQYAVKPGFEVDFSFVTGDWRFHLAIMPEKEANKDIEIAFVDALGTYYKMTVPGSMLPEGQQWNEIDLYMADFMDLGLDFAKNGLVKADNSTGARIFFQVNGVKDTEADVSRIGLDDVYLTDDNPESETTPTGIQTVSQKGGAYLIQGNGLLKVVNNSSDGFSVYNENGQEVLRTGENVVSIAGLLPGLYMVKTQNQVIKFIKNN